MGGSLLLWVLGGDGVEWWQGAKRSARHDGRAERRRRIILGDRCGS